MVRIVSKGGNAMREFQPIRAPVTHATEPTGVKLTTRIVSVVASLKGASPAEALESTKRQRAPVRPMERNGENDKLLIRTHQLNGRASRDARSSYDGQEVTA